MEPKVAKISLTLPQTILDAINNEAKEMNREGLYHMQRIIEEHALNNGSMPGSTVQERLMFWRLVDEAIDKAVSIWESQGPSRDVTAQTFAACEKDPDWLNRYETFVGGPAKAKGNPKKGLINREIGYRIRARLSAQVEKIDGKTVNVKVTDSIIQSFSAFTV